MRAGLREDIPSHSSSIGISRKTSILSSKDFADFDDFFKSENSFFARERRLAVRQTIKTAKITAVGQADAQILNLSAVRIN